MADRIDMTGTWKGVYFYPSESPVPVPKDGVPFCLELKQGWFGRFSGTVQDDPVLGVPEQGWIRGRAKVSEIWFVKRLPVLRVRSRESTNETARDFLARYGIRQDRLPRHPPIYYSGRLHDDRSIRGEWLLKARHLYLGDRFFSMPETRGTWVMEKLHGQ